MEEKIVDFEAKAGMSFQDYASAIMSQEKGVYRCKFNGVSFLVDTRMEDDVPISSLYSKARDEKELWYLWEDNEKVKTAERMIERTLSKENTSPEEALNLVYLLGSMYRTNRQVPLPSNLGKFMDMLKSKGFKPVDAKDEYREGYYGSWMPVDPSVPNEVKEQGKNKVAIYLIENFMKQAEDQMKRVPDKKIKDSLCDLIEEEFPEVGENAKKMVQDMRKRIAQKEDTIKQELLKNHAHIAPDKSVYYINFKPIGTVHFENEDGTSFEPDIPEEQPR